MNQKPATVPTAAARCLIAGLVMPVFAASAPAQEWPEWRGAGGQGISREQGIPESWSESFGIAWKVAVPGRGHSTPVMGGGRIWLTTAVEIPAGPDETARRLKENTGDQPVTVLESVSLRAVCFDLRTGRQLHDVELLKVSEPQWVHALNSYASPSPVLHNGRLYAHFGSLGTACMDTGSAAVLWRNQELQIMHENGPGSSPVLWENRLIVHYDGSDRQFIAAYDTATGKVAWQTPRSGDMDPRPQQKKAYGTPLVVQIRGNPVVVSPAANWVYGYHPSDGREIWKQPYGELGFSMSVRPVSDDSRVYVSTSFGTSQIIALEYKDREVPVVLWKNARNAPKMSSPVLVDGLLYYVDDGGILSCVDSITGEHVYRERLEGKFSASPVAAEGRLYFPSREGVVYVIAAGRDFKVLAKNKIEGTIMASPVPVHGGLLLRTERMLYLAGSVKLPGE